MKLLRKFSYYSVNFYFLNTFFVTIPSIPDFGIHLTNSISFGIS